MSDENQGVSVMAGKVQNSGINPFRLPLSQPFAFEKKTTYSADI